MASEASKRQLPESRASPDSPWQPRTRQPLVGRLASGSTHPATIRFRRAGMKRSTGCRAPSSPQLERVQEPHELAHLGAVVEHGGRHAPDEHRWLDLRRDRRQEEVVVVVRRLPAVGQIQALGHQARGRVLRHQIDAVERPSPEHLRWASVDRSWREQHVVQQASGAPNGLVVESPLRGEPSGRRAQARRSKDQGLEPVGDGPAADGEGAGPDAPRGPTVGDDPPRQRQ